ncbi:sterol desaturase family protein [Hyphobacterium sp.]|uniref:sterol desaturase family protein n=1 Tax=Hyphobacterium sp. TaxID=2004662 RepID=UPI003BAB3472
MDTRLLVPVIFAGFALAEILTRRFFQPARGSARDVWIEAVGTPIFILITVPAIFFAVPVLMEAAWPGSEGAWADWPWWAMVLILLIGDDMTQYWWHRAAHTFPWLYNLHRAHHSGAYLNIRIVYRNAIAYYIFMPGLWIAAALVHLGFGPVYAIYLVVKMTVIFGAHSSLRWDEPLYRIKWLSPVMWVVERTISTPATHFAHHGLHKDDGVTHYKGNYGNLLFFWDVVFGTALITRRYPETYGIENLEDRSAAGELAWPVIRK